MLHGVIPVLKPAGMTSHDVVAQIRRYSGQKRVGHTGTLDPDVKGVLPVCLGQATRIAEYIQQMPKRYQGTLVLGVSTDTQDASGMILDRKEVAPLTSEEVDEVFAGFVGKVSQVPPMYSAIKVKGRRLYEWAREGKEVIRQPRDIHIYHLKRRGMTEGDFPCIHFDVECSKGTYVRTLCVDLGQALGYPAHMSHLIRTTSGPFVLQDSFSLEEIKEIASADLWKDILVEPGDALVHLPSLIISKEDYIHVMNGMALEWPGPAADVPDSGLFRVFTEEGTFCAVYRWEDEGRAYPEKVFRVR